MIRILAATLLLIGLSACHVATQEENYCASFGVKPDSEEYEECTKHYFTQIKEYKRDFALCSSEADGFFPGSTFSRPAAYPVRKWGSYSRFPDEEPLPEDAQIITDPKLHRQRLEIIEPCMQVRGWNSAMDWQRGRHPANMIPLRKPKPLISPPEPWLQPTQ